jgi:hypothetical protein
VTDEATREEESQRGRRAPFQSAKNRADRACPGVVAILFQPGLVSEEEVVDGKDAGDALAETCADVARDAQEPQGQVDVPALGAPPLVGYAIQGVSGPRLPAFPVECGLEKGAFEGFESLGVSLLGKRSRAVGSEMEDGCSQVGTERGRIQGEGAAVRVATCDGEGKARPGLPRPDEVRADIAAFLSRRSFGAGLRDRRLEGAVGSRGICGGDEEPACARPNFLRQFPPSCNGAKCLAKRNGAVLDGACGSPKSRASFLSGTLHGKARHGRRRACWWATGGNAGEGKRVGSGVECWEALGLPGSRPYVHGNVQRNVAVSALGHATQHIEAEEVGSEAG